MTDKASNSNPGTNSAKTQDKYQGGVISDFTPTEIVSVAQLRDENNHRGYYIDFADPFYVAPSVSTEYNDWVKIGTQSPSMIIYMGQTQEYYVGLRTSADVSLHGIERVQ